MSRYIDADEFYVSQVARCWGEPIIGTCTSNNTLLYNELQKMPTADVAEVKHGEWVHGECVSHCSECGVETYPENITPYCPNCGLRMDGGDFDEMPNNKSKEQSAGA